MRITEDQKRIIDSFSCERLSSNPDNKNLIQSFHSVRGNSLVAYMCNIGWQEDIEGRTAFYLVKSEDGMPCLFFALKCGGLFKPLNEDEIQKDINSATKFLYLLLDDSEENQGHMQLIQNLEEFRRSQNIPLEDVVNGLAKNAKIELSKHKRTLQLIEGDKRREGTRPIQRVSTSLPGVEITHFCTNDDAKSMWKTYGFRYPMGQVFFWKFIVPKFIELQSIVGCQFAYLFAADQTEDRTLSNYYNVSLKFQRGESLGTIKPRYDFCCEFLSQNVNEMKNNMQKFWNDFNLDPQEEVV